MPIIRKANNDDQAAVFRILRELDLEYPGLLLGDFWVADLDGMITSVGRLQEFSDFCFLSSLGTTVEKQGRGLAAKLLKSMLKHCKKDIYLYTIIPDFFKKFGFEPTVLISGLPDRQTFNCTDCDIKNCVCMKRKA